MSDTAPKPPEDPTDQSENQPAPKYVITRPSFDLRDRAFWNILGWVSTGLWVAYVLTVTQGKMEHPLFDWIFLAPLIGWIVLMIVSRIVTRAPGDSEGP